MQPAGLKQVRSTSSLRCVRTLLPCLATTFLTLGSHTALAQDSLYEELYELAAYAPKELPGMPPEEACLFEDSQYAKAVCIESINSQLDDARTRLFVAEIPPIARSFDTKADEFIFEIPETLVLTCPDGYDAEQFDCLAVSGPDAPPPLRDSATLSAHGCPLSERRTP